MLFYVLQGQFEISRELLQEAKLSSQVCIVYSLNFAHKREINCWSAVLRTQVFEDGHTVGKFLLTQALLAAREKRVSECIDYICQAQVRQSPLCVVQFQCVMLVRDVH